MEVHSRVRCCLAPVVVTCRVLTSGMAAKSAALPLAARVDYALRGKAGFENAAFRAADSTLQIDA